MQDSHKVTANHTNLNVTEEALFLPTLGSRVTLDAEEIRHRAIVRFAPHAIHFAKVREVV